MQEPSLLGVSLAVIYHFIWSDRLTIREEDLFTRLLAWAKDACLRSGSSDPPSPVDLRRAMLPFLKGIRFPIMRIREFEQRVVKTGILEGKEAADVLLSFMGFEEEDKESEGGTFSRRMRSWFPVDQEVEERESCPNSLREQEKAARDMRPVHRVFRCSGCRATVCGACARLCHKTCDKSGLRHIATGTEPCSCLCLGSCAFTTIVPRTP